MKDRRSRRRNASLLWLAAEDGVIDSSSDRRRSTAPGSRPHAPCRLACPSAKQRQGSTPEGARRRRWLDPREPGRRKPATPHRSDFNFAAAARQGLESLSSMTRTDARRLKHSARVPSSSGDAPSCANHARADALGLDPDDAVTALRSTRARASTAQKTHRAAVAPGSRRQALPGSAFPSGAAGSSSQHAPGSAVPGDSSEWRAAGDVPAAEETRGPTVGSVAADPTGPAGFSRFAADSREAPPRGASLATSLDDCGSEETRAP